MSLRAAAKQHSPKIAPLLQDDDPEVRGHAACALGKLGVAAYAKSIARLLRDENAEVRKDAAWALGALRSQRRI